MKIHQSDLKSFTRCGEQHRRQLGGEQGPQLSATAFGSVMHHALHVLERERDVELAVNTFDHYWHPLNIDQICSPVEEWIANQSYGTLRQKGIETLRRYWDLKAYDDEEVLALEIPFAVEIPETWDDELGEPHVLLGTIDRLAVRYYRRQMHLCIDDWKTGKKPNYLRHNIQFGAYCFATTQRTFWQGNPAYYTEGFGSERGAELYTRFGLHATPRHGWWINVMGGPHWIDAGLRTDLDYRRFFHAVNQYAKARQHGIFPLSIEGDVCRFCSFNTDCPGERA